ncbi:MAG TPA: FtsQ-type POTRA domain-containing protein [Candidatus Limnocylindrales bacterium]|nr:FtsQ-type POTRA domain-containing protein [Candidatus Limnocylindrales bacterium]
MSGKALRPRRRSSGHARRPGRPLRSRVRGRLPSRGRVLAVLLFTAAVAGLVTLVNGPWLRVIAVAHVGERYTSTLELDQIMDGYRGVPLLSVDSEVLRRRLTELPAVADAQVTMQLPGELRVSITEKRPAFIWRTTAVQLIGTADGSIITELLLSGQADAGLRGLPVVQDERYASRALTVGDVLPEAELRVALRLIALDPDVIGSRARRLSVSMDDEHGFLIASLQPAWRAAMGFYQLDPREDRAAADARLDRQLAAIRTLFVTRHERAVSWLDARNPGKVYWAP